MRVITLVLLALILAGCNDTQLSPNRPESQLVKSGGQYSNDSYHSYHVNANYISLPVAVPTPSPTAISFPVTVTFYTANSPEQGTGDRTASGKPVSRGMVAVNSRMLEKYPFGTKVFIHGIGAATIEDVGGGPDDWMDYYHDGTVEEALKLGVKRTTATLQAPP